MMIELNKVNKVYKGYGGSVHALIDATLSIAPGDNVLIVGKSGSGKSTLLNVITGIDRPESGDIRINGTLINELAEGPLSSWRGRTIGIVFQFYQLLPTLTAIDNLLFAMEIVNIIPKKQRLTRAQHILDEVGLSGKMKKYPNELSGGEKQRVAIARALANDPPILVADEPTGNLDSKTSEQIHVLFQKLNQAGKTVIKVTHEDISHLSFNKAYRISDGMIQNLTKA